MRKLFIALALALALLLPGTPAPTRAGTFEFEITGPVLALFQASATLTDVTAVACLGTTGASVPWFVVTADFDGQVDEGYLGATARLGDKPDKFKATFNDKAKDAASEEIQFFDVDASADPDTGTAAGVKGTMKGKAKRYAVDPEDLGDAAGTSGRLKVVDKTGKRKLIIDANFAFKVTETTCSVEFDEEGKAVSVRIGGLAGGQSIRLGSGR